MTVADINTSYVDVVLSILTVAFGVVATISRVTFRRLSTEFDAVTEDHARLKGSFDTATKERQQLTLSLRDVSEQRDHLATQLREVTEIRNALRTLCKAVAEGLKGHKHGSAAVVNEIRSLAKEKGVLVELDQFLRDAQPPTA